MSEHTIRVLYRCRNCQQDMTTPSRCEGCGGVQFEPIGKPASAAADNARRQRTLVSPVTPEARNYWIIKRYDDLIDRDTRRKTR